MKTTMLLFCVGKPKLLLLILCPVLYYVQPSNNLDYRSKSSCNEQVFDSQEIIVCTVVFGYL